MSYSVTATSLPGVLILEPKVFGDARGFFYESYNATDFQRAVKESVEFVQDNHSKSVKGVLRGFHYQLQHAQGKLVRVLSGKVQDVAVDIRRSSPNYGKWVGVMLSGENKRQVWIPHGFAHGFLVVSESAEILYKTTDYWHPEHERSIRWNDADLGVEWELGAIAQTLPVLSLKDKNGVAFATAETYA